MENKKKNFGLPFFLGSIVGAVAALFITPKTGKEMREMAKKWLREEVEKIKKEVGNIDKRKFKKAVQKVIEKAKNELKADMGEINKLKRLLLAKWESLKKSRSGPDKSSLANNSYSVSSKKMSSKAKSKLSKPKAKTKI